MNFVTVSYAGNLQLLAKDFAELHNIEPNYEIQTEAEYYEILRNHVNHQISKLKMRIAAKDSKN